VTDAVRAANDPARPTGAVLTPRPHPRSLAKGEAVR
jgi:hypothetical protein